MNYNKVEDEQRNEKIVYNIRNKCRNQYEFLIE